MMDPLKIEHRYFETLKAGDERSVEFYFKSHYRSLAYFAFRLLGDSQEAEDVAAEAFVKLWHHREALEKPTSVKSYLYMVVKNASLDIIRKSKVRASHMGAYQVQIEEPSVLACMIEAELIRQLIAHSRSLPFKARQVFELSYVEGKSNKEIAVMLGISESTVKSQKARAIQLLRGNLPAFAIALFLWQCQSADASIFQTLEFGSTSQCNH